MKKTLIALAAVGLVGSAFAQDSVSLYGRVSFDYNSFKKDSAVDTSGKYGYNIQQANAAFGSYVGIKGKEALSENTNAVFKVERGFNLTNNSAGANRQAYLGLENANVGSIYFGRKDTLANDHVGDFDPLDTAGYLTSGLNNAGERVNQSITYFSPSFGGFGVDLQTNFKQKRSGSEEKMYYAARVKYNSDFGLNASVTASKNFPSLDNNGAWYQKSKLLTQAAVSYDFGSAKVGFQYENDKNEKKKNTFELNASTNFDNVGLAAYLGYGYGAKEKRFGVVSTYSLSKRTVAYVGGAYAKFNKDNKVNNKKGDHQVTVGVVHNF